MRRPWLNIDAGELENEPEELYALAHVVNVACGGHAGDVQSMTRVMDVCKRLGTRVGAHPSYPDRAGFGRARMAMSEDALLETIAEQCHALASVARQAHVRTGFAKPHGALYHAANADAAIARATLRGIVEGLGWEITVIGPPSGFLKEMCQELGLGYAREGFADRGVRPDGSLVPRTDPGALLTDPVLAAARARQLIASVDTVCVHGDTPNATAIARAVRDALISHERPPKAARNGNGNA